MSETSIASYNVALSSNPSPQVTLAGVFVVHQSLSRPVPHYKAQGPLQFRMGVNKGNEQLAENEHLVWLAVAAEYAQPDNAVVVRAEVKLEAIAVCVDLGAAELDYQLTRVLPGRLFAHARVQIEALTRDSGYAAITLPPVPLDPAETQQGAAQ